MKCSHDACTREAEENGYCKVCIQLPSKECNFCKPEEKVDMTTPDGHCLIDGAPIGSMCKSDCADCGLYHEFQKEVLGLKAGIKKVMNKRTSLGIILFLAGLGLGLCYKVTAVKPFAAPAVSLTLIGVCLIVYGVVTE